MRVSVQPHGVVSASTQLLLNSDGERRPETESVAIAPGTQDLRLVPVEQFHIPRNSTTKSWIVVLARGQVAEEQNSKVKALLRRNSAKERHLVLDRMADDVSEPYHLTPRRPT